VLTAVVAGYAQTPTPSAADGFDPNVDGNVYAIATLPDGKILVAGQFGTFRPSIGPAASRNNLARLNPDGSIDLAFDPNANGTVRALAVQADGKIVIGGDFTALQPNLGATTKVNRLARLNKDGSVDPTFNADVGGGYTPQVYAVLIQPTDGSIVLGGGFTSVDGVARNRIARVSSTGALDPTFDPNADNLVFALAAHYNGQILVAGGFTNIGGQARNFLARLNPNGTADAGFDPSANGRATALAVQRDGKIFAGGDFTTVQPNGIDTPATRNHLVRLNTDGSLDTAFNGNANANVVALAVQPDGGLIVGGGFSSVWGAGGEVEGRNYLARFNPDGSLDLVFGAGVNNIVDAIAFQPDGKIVIGGYFTGLLGRSANTSAVRNRLARINADGSLDTTLNLDASGRPVVSLLQSDGKILIGGTFTSVGGVTHNRLARLNADGSVDPTFTPDLDGRVLTIAQQSNGQIVIGGGFATVDGVTRHNLARLNADGSLDTAFDPSPNGPVSAVAIQSDGKMILFAGNFTVLSPNGATTGTNRNYIARVSVTDGSIDTTFNPLANNTVAALALQPDGKILIGGSFSTLTPNAPTTVVNGVATVTTAPTSRGNIARLNPDGTLDPVFNPNVNGQINTIVVQSDGKIVVGGTFSALFPSGDTVFSNRNRLVRLKADGTVDTTFNPNVNNTVATLALQADGKILVGGPFTTFTPNSDTAFTLRKYIARLNTDGTVDSTFNLDLDEQNGNRVDWITVQPDAKILVSGKFASLQPLGATVRVTRNQFMRLKADGTLDTAFQANAGGSPGGQFNALVVQADGKIVAGGLFGGVGGETTANLARFIPEGGSDVTFSSGFNSDGPVNAIVSRPDPVAVVLQGTGIAWLTTDGTVNTAFAPNDSSRLNGTVAVIAPQADGHILVGGSFLLPSTGNLGANLVRYDSKGVADPTFTPEPNGGVNAIAFDANGGILVGGSFTTMYGVERSRLARLNPDGTLDLNFDPHPDATVNSIVVQPDGLILIGGSFNTITPNFSSTTTTTTATVTPAPPPSTNSVTNGDGSTTTTTISTDTTTGITTTTVTTLTGTAITRPFFARLNPDGTVDTTFDPGPNAQVLAIVRQPNDGALVIGGAFTTMTPTKDTSTTPTTLQPTVRNNLARVNADGSLDPNYDPEANGAVEALVLQPDGNLLVGGLFTTINPNATVSITTTGGITTSTIVPTATTRNYLARLNGAGGLDLTFNPNLNSEVHSLALQPDGKILVGGTFNSLQPNVAGYASTAATRRSRIARLLPDGSIDAGFNPNANDSVGAIAVLPDKSVLIGGAFTALQPNGVLLVGGQFSNISGVQSRNLALLNDDGTATSTFQPNPNGAVLALLLQPDGKTIVAGGFTKFDGVGATGTTRNRLARFNADGTLDATFDPNANDYVVVLALQNDGKIVVGGTFTSVSGQRRINLARLNADGTLDASYAPVLAGSTGVGALAVQADGKLLVLYSRSGIGGILARFNVDGSPDASFAPIVTGASALALQTDGKILVGGSFTGYLARLNADGTPDPTFNPAPNGPVTALALQPDGRLVIAGSFSTVGGLARGGLARLATSTVVTQTIAASRTTLLWTRDGGGPELSVVTFEQSADAIKWTKLGSATRVGGTRTWQIAGLSLPTSGLFYVRARGYESTSSGTSSTTILTVREFNLAATPGVGPAGSAVTATVAGLTIDASTGLLTGANGTAKITAKVTGAGTEVGQNIILPSNGYTYDQVLMQGASVTITADPGQITRTSFVDLNDDIVQVEFSGAGTLTITLDQASGPAVAVNYNQPDVAYMKGHAAIVILGANETTNVAIFSVGRLTAANPALLKGGVTYDGVADLAYLAILTTDGRFGGVRTADASYFATDGVTGIYAPGVQFGGPVYVGDISASGNASPVLLLGSASDVRVTGGDLWQANGQPVQVSGITQLKFVDGTTSGGAFLPAQADKSRLMQNGADVTTQLVVNPSP